jgi:hypothetical protein
MTKRKKRKEQKQETSRSLKIRNTYLDFNHIYMRNSFVNISMFRSVEVGMIPTVILQPVPEQEARVFIGGLRAKKNSKPIFFARTHLSASKPKNHTTNCPKGKKNKPMSMESRSTASP